MLQLHRNSDNFKTTTCMKKILSASLLLALWAIPGSASDFDACFADSTLRIDYVFGGGPRGASVMLDTQSKSAGWYGKRHRLSKVPLEGNGSIFVTDPATGDTLYRQSFSSLFQEWIYIPEAKQISRSFENSFLVPLPKREADITVVLNDNRHKPIASSTHRYRPDDELVEARAVSPYYHEYVHRGGDPRECIDIAMVAEGYTEGEKDLFIADAKRMAEEILSYEPYASRKDRFNILAVMTPSRDSGVSVPLEGIWKDTAFGSHYSTFYSSRYLTAPKVKKLHESLHGLPYEHIMILANTDRYGGGGIYNSYQLATTHNEHSLPVTVHEFGHSFGGLADEYFYTDEQNDTYPLDIEPWEPNITTMTDFDSKWKDMIEPGTPIPTPTDDKGGNRGQKMSKDSERKHDKPVVGVYEGGGYRAKGVYRPVETCRMRDNYYPAFCPVCEASIARLIDFYTKPCGKCKK